MYIYLGAAGSTYEGGLRWKRRQSLSNGELDNLSGGGRVGCSCWMKLFGKAGGSEWETAISPMGDAAFI